MNLFQSYCIKECASWILSNNFKQVGLEFPPNQRHIFSLCKLLEKEIGFKPVVLLDSMNTTVGNCCVDERTAKPRAFDAIIHFGRTCLTPTISLPVLYVLNSQISFNSSKLTELILTSSDGPKEDEDIILLYDICFTPFISSFYDTLKTNFPNLILSKLVIHEKAKLTFYNDSENLYFDEPNINETNKNIIINKRSFILPKNKDLKDYNFIYICSESESPAMLSYHMRFSDKVFYRIDHDTQSFTRTNFLKTVMGRSRKIEQVREAKNIGILITLINNHKEIADRIERLIASNNKKCQRFLLGKVTEPKLGNICGMDVFVYIACAESSLFDRNEDEYLYKNIVTPWELEVALNPLYEWSLNFETNFSELLTFDIKEEPEEGVKEESLPEETNYFQEREKDNTEIMEKGSGTLHKMHENGPGEFLQSLSWKGLDLNEESPVAIGTVVEGRSGIPMMYDNELKYKT